MRISVFFVVVWVALTLCSCPWCSPHSHTFTMWLTLCCCPPDTALGIWLLLLLVTCCIEKPITPPTACVSSLSLRQSSDTMILVLGGLYSFTVLGKWHRDTRLKKAQSPMQGSSNRKVRNSHGSSQLTRMRLFDLECWYASVWGERVCCSSSGGFYGA